MGQAVVGACLVTAAGPTGGRMVLDGVDLSSFESLYRQMLCDSRSPTELIGAKPLMYTSLLHSDGHYVGLYVHTNTNKVALIDGKKSPIIKSIGKHALADLEQRLGFKRANELTFSQTLKQIDNYTCAARYVDAISHHTLAYTPPLRAT